MRASTILPSLLALLTTTEAAIKTSIWIDQIPAYSALAPCAENRVSAVVRAQASGCGDDQQLTSFACFCVDQSSYAALHHATPALHHATPTHVETNNPVPQTHVQHNLNRSPRLLRSRRNNPNRLADRPPPRSNLRSRRLQQLLRPQHRTSLVYVPRPHAPSPRTNHPRPQTNKTAQPQQPSS